MIVSFIYQIHGIRYNGKYIGQIPDNYEEGLDIGVLKIISPELMDYYHLENLSDITLAVVSTLRDSKDYFSENEKLVLDLLYCNWGNQPKEVYIYGIQITK